MAGEKFAVKKIPSTAVPAGAESGVERRIEHTQPLGGWAFRRVYFTP